MSFNSEQKKWDEIYSRIHSIEEPSFMSSFNDELVNIITELLPEGGELLEAGSGGGWQSLALARTGKYQVTLLDFSNQALNYSKSIFNKAGISGNFIQGNIFDPGKKKYDLVFNAGVIEHYSRSEQVEMIKSMASQSLQYILVLAPNIQCYWYWIWRFNLKVENKWPYGVENPIHDLSSIFNDAGIDFIGHRFLGTNWTNEFIKELPSIGDDLRLNLLEIHKLPHIPLAQKSYLIAGLGTVKTLKKQFSSNWIPSINAYHPISSDLLSTLDDLAATKIDREKKINKLNIKLEGMRSDVASLRQEIIQKDDLIQHQQSQLFETSKKMAEIEANLINKEGELSELYSSHAWQLVKWIWKFRLAIFPTTSFQSRAAHTIKRLFLQLLKIIKKGIISVFRCIIPVQWKQLYYAIRKDTPILDNSEVVVFSFNDNIFPNNNHYLLSNDDLQLRAKKVSLITTCLNEEQQAAIWLDSLMQQDRLPDELVVVDGGSTDKTVDILKKFASRATFPVKLIIKEGANIATGRNIAIKNSNFDLIACTDMGCKLSQAWLACIIAPFEVDPSVRVSFGHSSNSKEENDYSKYFIQNINNISPKYYLPSSRTIAFDKAIWAKVGGYPEYLTDGGEDTYFDVMLKKEPARFSFTPEAVVEWYGPKSLRQVLTTAKRYSFGDGETGLFAKNYWIKIKINLFLLCSILIAGIICIVVISIGKGFALAITFAILLIFILTYSLLKGLNPLNFWKDYLIVRAISFYQSIGFVQGAANRSKVTKRLGESLVSELNTYLQKFKDAKGIIIYLPTHDWSFMFQRPQQIARAFACEGYLFFYCTNNERTDSVSTFLEVEERVVLCHVPLETFNQITSPIVYVGAPFLRPLLEYFDKPFVIYDHYDDIMVSSSKIEDHEHLLRTANIVIATSDRLVDSIKNVRPDLLQIPNGVDYEFIERKRLSTISPPEDLVELIGMKKPIVGYSGALANWFDYELLRETAKLRSNFEFVLIGVNYDRSLDKSGILSIPNIHWLGMKNYEEVFSYIHKFDIAIIPFKVNNITLATSPIKLFEYAACHKPIISTPLPECIKYSQVQIASTPMEFAEALDTAIERKHSKAYIHALDALARENSWKQRVQTIDNRMKQLKEILR